MGSDKEFRVFFQTFGRGITDFDETKFTREDICKKSAELEQEGFEIISISESYVPASFNDGSRMFFQVTIYYKRKESDGS